MKKTRPTCKIAMKEIEAMLKGSITESLIGAIPNTNTTLEDYRADKLRKHLEILRERTKHDEAQALSHAQQKGRTEGAEQAIISAIKNNIALEVLEQMCKSIGIPLTRLAELMKQA